MDLPKILFLEFADNNDFLKMPTNFGEFTDFVSAGVPFVRTIFAAIVISSGHCLQITFDVAKNICE